LDVALDIVQIIVCVLLMLVILTQAKGSGFSGSTFGGDSGSIYRTRRGVEKTLFQFTIVIGIIFLLLSIVASIVE
jgi:preprotein translocase subunit SecG